MSYEQDLEKSVTLKDVTNDVSRVEERSGGTSREATLKEDDLIEMRGPAFRFFGKLFSMGVEARGIEVRPRHVPLPNAPRLIAGQGLTLWLLLH
jgi:hypothetical protein